MSHIQTDLSWESTLSKHGFGFSADTPGVAAGLQALTELAQTVEGLEVRIVYPPGPKRAGKASARPSPSDPYPMHVRWDTG